MHRPLNIKHNELRFDVYESSDYIAECERSVTMLHSQINEEQIKCRQCWLLFTSSFPLPPTDVQNYNSACCFVQAQNFTLLQEDHHHQSNETPT